MGYRYLDIARTPTVVAAQAANDVAEMWEHVQGRRESNRLTDAEAAFIAARDSFYLATVSETGWPYVQHRGGPPGFLKVLDETTLGFADFRGNRQYITLGNLGANGRASLFLMDYPNRRRLKIFARIEPRDLPSDPELAARLFTPGYRARPERALIAHVEAFDWNCPQHITPRFTEDELAAAMAPVRERIERLEAENAALRATLAAKEASP
ncbi:MAG: pyridoxamine 5'-phosphate oxidase family protein [Proteobacteria bacterium]|nr:pyridoxamine 5'-phosphate oxidase family protein [Pseudomonadota bacterium]